MLKKVVFCTERHRGQGCNECEELDELVRDEKMDRAGGDEMNMRHNESSVICRSLRRVLCALAALLFSGSTFAQSSPVSASAPPIAWFNALVGLDETAALTALEKIEREWDPSAISLLVDALPYSASVKTSESILFVLKRNTDAPLDLPMNGIYEWLWSRERATHPNYAAFKAALLGQIDPHFAEHFAGQPTSLIRYDEIRWGGVRRDGIPPLKNPKMIAAAEAKWLADDHIIFGVALNGDVRAYPKRILAWHEMFKDRIGGVDVAGVYCTLCGALVIYDVAHAGVTHELGTSGFLYRSNKLMYDHDTKSLWSTLEGSPVLGPLVNKGIALTPLHVVTTTWKEWRSRHPNTTVLSLDTGHERDYGEGVAYREYFSSDKLMFNVPKIDTRLRNKDEVLALRNAAAPHEPLAISAAFLAKRPVHHVNLGARRLVVLTDASGANRVYLSGAVRFASFDGKSTVVDTAGKRWKLDEAQLTPVTETTAARALPRAAAHRAFWFGWVAQFPNTRLVK